MKNKFISVVTVAALTVFSLGFVPTSQASASKEQSEKFIEQVEYVQENATPLNDTQLESIADKVELAIESNEIKVNNSDELNYEKATGYQFSEEDDNIQTVTIPFKENSETDVSSLNSLTVAFDTESKVTEYSEIVVSETAETATAIVYVNGSEAGTTTIEKTPEFQTFGYIDRVNDCMERFGVNPDTAALALSVCGLVCTVSLGTLCVPCLGTVGAAGGGVIVGCFLNS